MTNETAARHSAPTICTVAASESLTISPPLEGDAYTLEGDREGRHGSIMKYNLNKGE